MTWTNAQAEAIASELEGKGLSGTKCYVGMRYWHPFTEAALEAIENDGVNALVSRTVRVAAQIHRTDGGVVDMDGLSAPMADCCRASPHETTRVFDRRTA